MIIKNILDAILFLLYMGYKTENAVVEIFLNLHPSLKIVSIIISVFSAISLFIKIEDKISDYI